MSILVCAKFALTKKIKNKVSSILEHTATDDDCRKPDGGERYNGKSAGELDKSEELKIITQIY